MKLRFLAWLFWNKQSRYCHDPDVVVGIDVGIGLKNFNLGHISIITAEDIYLILGTYVRYQKSKLYHQGR